MIRLRFRCTNSSTLLVLTLIWFLCEHGTLKTIASAQDVEPHVKAEQTAEVEFGEAEEETTDDEELFDIRRELNKKLKQLQAEAENTRRRIQLVDRCVAISRQARKLEAQIRKAEDSNDDALADSLQNKFERVITELATNEELLEIEHEIALFQHELRDADEEDRQRFRTLESLLSDLKKVRSITQELMLISLGGPDSGMAKLEEEKANAQTRIQKAYRVLDVIDSLHEAQEDDDDELVEQLEEKLLELTSGHHRLSGGERPLDNLVAAPVMRPILVNEQTLAPYANVNLQRDVVPLLRKYCFDCHDNNFSSGELNLERLLAESPIVKNRRQWINVIEQSRNHVMPPEDEQQPSREDRESIVLSLHQAVHGFDYGGIVDPGFETARRMTHREYSNTVRDLFGVDLNIVNRFPDDLTATSGFDNSANSQ